MQSWTFLNLKSRTIPADACSGNYGNYCFTRDFSKRRRLTWSHIILVLPKMSNGYFSERKKSMFLSISSLEGQKIQNRLIDTQIRQICCLCLLRSACECTLQIPFWSNKTRLPLYLLATGDGIKIIIVEPRSRTCARTLSFHTYEGSSMPNLPRPDSGTSWSSLIEFAISGRTVTSKRRIIVLTYWLRASQKQHAIHSSRMGYIMLLHNTLLNSGLYNIFTCIWSSSAAVSCNKNLDSMEEMKIISSFFWVRGPAWLLHAWMPPPENEKEKRLNGMKVNKILKFWIWTTDLQSVSGRFMSIHVLRLRKRRAVYVKWLEWWRIPAIYVF